MDAKVLRAARLRAGVSLAECGEALGISRQSYERRETGDTALQPEEWATLEALFASRAGTAPLTLAEQLRGARAWAERSQAECAAALGISREAYRAREAGAPEPTPAELERLAELFGRPRAQLFRYRPRRGPAPAAPLPPLAETLLEQLRYWRGVADFSLQQAATVLGVSREAYRQRETGVAPISGAELALLAHAYGRPLFEIFPAHTPTEGEQLLCQALVESGRA
jgi:transcriptional regulator with XRE-family HTH domain